jgi:hypothetical protein
MSLTALACCTIGLHLYSHHFPERDYQINANSGIYLRAENWQAGIYRNTIDRTTLYAAYSKPAGPFDLMAGLATGYQIRYRNHEKSGFSRSYLAPMAGISYAPQIKLLGARPRVFFAPGFGGSSNVLHLSVEY